MNQHTPDEVRELLRAVPFPGLHRDIVAFGFVRDIDVKGTAVTVTFAPNTTSEEKVQEMEEGIRQTLYQEGYVLVQVRTEPPFDDDAMLLGAGTMNPLQMELLEEGIEPQPDVFAGAQGSAGAPAGPMPMEAQVPTPIAGPDGGPDESYQGPVPVFQWEVDPADETAPTGETAVLDGDWEFRVWWQQRLERDLVYASMQAVRDDWATHEGHAREHPVGRTEAVNLVYDTRRCGVVAIYGTVRDFRPFVDAFCKAYGLAVSDEDDASASTAAAPTDAPAAAAEHRCTCGARHHGQEVHRE